MAMTLSRLKVATGPVISVTGAASRASGGTVVTQASE